MEKDEPLGNAEELVRQESSEEMIRTRQGIQHTDIYHMEREGFLLLSEKS